MYLFLLSQEHPTLPRAEAEAVLTAYGVDHEIEQKDHLLLVEAETLPDLSQLAMTFEVAELLYRFQPDQYQKLATKDLEAEHPFAVRATAIDDTVYPDELEQNIGRIIDRRSEASVDLDQPEELFRVYLHDDEAYLTRIVTEIDRSSFESRQNQYRPFSRPVSIHPRLARTLVNLAGVTDGDTVLDPFCGTGGILIEAALIGCQVSGLDIEAEMVSGTKKNLATYSLDGDVRHGAIANITDIFDRTFDAVVTDLPYGQASKKEDDPADTFLEIVPDIADRAVFVSNDPSLNGMEPEHELFVHRSLSRYVYILD